MTFEDDELKIAMVDPLKADALLESMADLADIWWPNCPVPSISEACVALIHGVREGLWTDPEIAMLTHDPLFISELNLLVDAVDETRRDIENHPVLFEVCKRQLLALQGFREE